MAWTDQDLRDREEAEQLIEQGRLMRDRVVARVRQRVRRAKKEQRQ